MAVGHTGFCLLRLANMVLIFELSSYRARICFTTAMEIHFDVAVGLYMAVALLSHRLNARWIAIRW